MHLRARSRALVALTLALAAPSACRPAPTSPPAVADASPRPKLAPADPPVADPPAPDDPPPGEPTPPPPPPPVHVDPSINDHYRERPRASYWQGRLERDGREVYARRQAILAELDLREGMVVADIGAGTGLFTLLFARAVGPSGQVYAVDLMANFREHVARRSRKAGLQNVTTVAATASSCGLAPASIDLAFLSDVYHHIEEPTPYLASIRAALRPGGVLVLIDFKRIPGVSDPWILSHVRAGREVVLAELSAAGFELIDAPAILEENYFLRLRVRDGRENAAPTGPAPDRAGE